MSIANKNKEIYLIAPNIRSLYNVGSLFRSADAFGVAKIYLCGYTGGPLKFQFKQQIGKTALGAEKTVPWEKCQNVLALMKRLKKSGIEVVALETIKDSQPLNKFKPNFPLALVVGDEVKGLSKNILQQANHIVQIPMQGSKESLNVSVAAGIALFWLNGFRK